MYNLAIILHNFVNLTESCLTLQYLVITLNNFAKSVIDLPYLAIV